MTLQSRFFNSPSRDLDHALATTTASSSARVSSTAKPAPADAVHSISGKFSEPSIVQGGQHTSSPDGADKSASPSPSPSRLTVGPHIKLKGVEITDCDTLVVEGSVQASMDSRVMQIAEGGSFSGSAQIDDAEIRGEFDGQLTARHRLMLYATAKVKGQIRYGKLVMEEGAQLTGDVAFGAAMPAKSLVSNTTALLKVA